MARLNIHRPAPPIHTNEGAPAVRINAELQLRRALLSCLLWEDQFYESGDSIADRILKLIPQCDSTRVGMLAVEARSVFNLRHAPLLVLSGMARHKMLRAETVAAVIQRADELAELLAVHAKLNGTTPNKVKKFIPAQMKRGLAMAFAKFNEYALAKYDRAGAIRLRDALFLCHAKPADADQEALWKRLISGDLAVPDTWETQLSGGADKKETFTRLLKEGKLGYLALLRNLRNMTEAGVDTDLIKEAIVARKGGAERVFPFRFVAAARACPQLEPALDQALSEAISQSPVFKGKTVLLVDVSRSMDDKLSAKSDMTRMDAAAALASLFHGDRRVFTFSSAVKEVAPRFGMAGVEAIVRSQAHGGTELGKALEYVNGLQHDRLIVITDEQSHDRVGKPKAKLAYMINVASFKNGVGYGDWTHVDGFSEGILRYIQAVESEAPESNRDEMG